MSEENFERFKKCAVEVLSVEAGQVTKEARFAEDLDADSLDLVELVMELEEEFDISIPDDSAEKIQKVGEAVDFIESNKGDDEEQDDTA